MFMVYVEERRSLLRLGASMYSFPLESLKLVEGSTLWISGWTKCRVSFQVNQPRSLYSADLTCGAIATCLGPNCVLNFQVVSIAFQERELANLIRTFLLIRG